MTLKWGSCAFLAVVAALLAGCRTPQPNLKPPKTAEVLTVPPEENRYNSPNLPAQAFEKVDPLKNTLDTVSATPQGGGKGGGGMGGMGGMGGGR